VTTATNLKVKRNQNVILEQRLTKYDLDGKICWSISTEGYLEKAIPMVKEEFSNLFKAFNKKKVTIPAPDKYHPKLNTTEILHEYSHGLYHSYIGILR
jgi:phosphoenolpyruvate synthase/pyruvate phosphate dikinase